MKFTKETIKPGRILDWRYACRVVETSRVRHPPGNYWCRPWLHEVRCAQREGLPAMALADIDYWDAFVSGVHWDKVLADRMAAGALHCQLAEVLNA